MNKKDKFMFERDCLNKVKVDNRIGSKANKVIFGSGDYEHERTKFDVCWVLKELGHSFLAESAFKTGEGSADVLDYSEDIVYEILGSETIEEFNKNKFKYPVGMVIPIKAGTPIEEIRKIIGG